jgi:hypothetical protein
MIMVVVMMIPAIVVIVIAVRAVMMVMMPATVMVMVIIEVICAGSPRMSVMGQNEKVSRRAFLDRCTPESGRSFERGERQLRATRRHSHLQQNCGLSGPIPIW